MDASISYLISEALFPAHSSFCVSLKEFGEDCGDIVKRGRTSRERVWELCRWEQRVVGGELKHQGRMIKPLEATVQRDRRTEQNRTSKNCGTISEDRPYIPF